jgi:conjugal transfer pilus assembly protein TraU
MSTHIRIRFAFFAILFLLALPSFAQVTTASGVTCNGKFANPITDICWSCVLPITIGKIPLASSDQEDNNSNPASPICICPAPPPVFFRIGVAVGFWEPARQIEIVRAPYCFPSLGGITLNPGVKAPEAALDVRQATSSGMRGSFYQVHYYVNPILYYLEVLLDYSCVESGGFDLAYITEVDPLWNDDNLTAIINPEALLFANPIAIGACVGDCAFANFGFGLEALFWCSGCNGGIYPMNGHVPAQYGLMQGSSVLTHRMLGKMHRELLAWRYWGPDVLCGPVVAPMIDKTGYKTQLLYPVPNTAKITGRCCQPLGRSTVLWGAGKEFPWKGEDASYMVFRKRNCCAF